MTGLLATLSPVFNKWESVILWHQLAL